ncbi:MAG: hypothetical protein KDA58_08490 [Planctomycetaceae bacterium]|nr:hypothetical protein [Planctomycetaceae bacterium]
MRLAPENTTLARTSRLLHGSAPTSALTSGLILLGCSLLTAVCVTMVDLSLRIPGHAILRSILPITLGLALVPRHGNGSLLSGLSLLFAGGLMSLRWGESGMGALTSMALIGPSLDIATATSRTGWGLYLRCGLAGVAANFAAYVVRAGSKAASWDSLGMRPLTEWWSGAAVTYALCGLIAGVLSACLWFGMSTRSQSPESP